MHVQYINKHSQLSQLEWVPLQHVTTIRPQSYLLRWLCTFFFCFKKPKYARREAWETERAKPSRFYVFSLFFFFLEFILQIWNCGSTWPMIFPVGVANCQPVRQAFFIGKVLRQSISCFAMPSLVKFSICSYCALSARLQNCKVKAPHWKFTKLYTWNKFYLLYLKLFLSFPTALQ